jgi:hypothetical protein
MAQAAAVYVLRWLHASASSVTQPLACAICGLSTTILGARRIESGKQNLNLQSRRQLKTALLSAVAMGKRRAGGGVNFGAVEKQKKLFDVFSSFSRRRKRAEAASFALDFFCFFFGSMPKKINQNWASKPHPEKRRFHEG